MSIYSRGRNRVHRTLSYSNVHASRWSVPTCSQRPRLPGKALSSQSTRAYLLKQQRESGNSRSESVIQCNSKSLNKTHLCRPYLCPSSVTSTAEDFLIGARAFALGYEKPGAVSRERTPPPGSSPFLLLSWNSAYLGCEAAARGGKEKAIKQPCVLETLYMVIVRGCEWLGRCIRVREVLAHVGEVAEGLCIGREALRYVKIVKMVQGSQPGRIDSELQQFTRRSPKPTQNANRTLRNPLA